jgi:phosphopentomutase
MSRRVCVLLMDSFGIGASLDAARYGDQGADTFGHIFQACEQGKADIEGKRTGALHLPNLAKIGLFHAAMASTGKTLAPLDTLDEPTGRFGYAVETSLGKDTPSGHWEIAGVPVCFEWGYFPKTTPCFPESFVQALMEEGNLPGVLGNKHASGTHIIEELGEEHIQSGKPILYTSADSVVQIAAHEQHFGLQRLYDLCHIARRLADPLNIGRVIARPFVGESGTFSRTANRKDLSTPPPAPTLLDILCEQGREVIAVGKTADIFAHQGITKEIKAPDNMQLFDATLNCMQTAPAGSLVFTNFVDFDSLYGHRRDVGGYATALEAFDARLPELEAILQKGDMIVIAADHGCDPTQPGSDHTREHIPVLAFGPNLPAGFIGRRDSFADIGQSIAEWLAIAPLEHGISFL